jgi:hypothetical protein
MKYKSVYVAGALTNLKEENLDLKKVYEEIKTFLEEKGMSAYVPHLNTDPVKAPEILPQVVWEINVHAISKSDLVIAFVGIPSLGVGAELEIARVSNKDIVLWSFEGQKVTRMAFGNPKVIKHIIVKDFENLKDDLSMLV